MAMPAGHQTKKAVTIDRTPNASDWAIAHAAAAHLGGDLVDVAVDPVEQLADRRGLQRRQVLAERDPAQPRRTRRTSRR